MKIGLFTDTYYPEINGVAASVFLLKESLEAQGHCVYVFTTTTPNAPAQEHHVYRVPSIPINVRRLGSFINPRLKKTIKAIGLDLIHTHTEFSLGIFGRSVARALQIPFVHTMHTIYEEYTNYIFKYNSLEPVAKVAARKMTASFCNSADQVIVPTDKVKDLLLHYGVKRSISVIPTGIKLDKFSARRCDPLKIEAIRASLQIHAQDKVLINIGRQSEEKNIGEILRSLASYLPMHREVKLLLIGDGPAQDGLKKLATELCISEQVIFAGARPWDEIGLYYRLGNVFVSASQSETQGLTYIEALASGLPVVAKFDRCLEGVLIDGVDGYAFRCANDFHTILDNILYNEVKLAKLSQGAAQIADQYSAEQFVERVVTLYESMYINQQAYIKQSKYTYT